MMVKVNLTRKKSIAVRFTEPPAPEHEWLLTIDGLMPISMPPKQWARLALDVLGLPSLVALFKINNHLHLVHLDGKEVTKRVLRLFPQRQLKPVRGDAGVTLLDILTGNVEVEYGSIGTLPRCVVRVWLCERCTTGDAPGTVFSIFSLPLGDGDIDDYNAEYATSDTRDGLRFFTFVTNIDIL